MARRVGALWCGFGKEASASKLRVVSADELAFIRAKFIVRVELAKGILERAAYSAGLARCDDAWKTPDWIA